MGWEAHDGMGWWMLFGSIAWLIFIVAIIYFASTFAGGGAGREPRPQEPPLEIAKRRLAAGEITEDEFQRIKGHLGGS